MGERRLGRLAGEFILVVLGVLLALAVDNWRESASERDLEARYLARLVADLRADSATTGTAINMRVIQERHMRASVQALRGEGPGGSEALTSIFMATRGLWPTVSDPTYRDLLNTGRFELIRSDLLRAEILEYYLWVGEVILNVQALEDRVPFRDQVRGIIPFELQAELRLCGESLDATFRTGPDINMPEVCEVSISDSQVAALLNQLRSSPQILPNLNRWIAGFLATQQRLIEFQARSAELAGALVGEIDR